ncbi:unnamed protein product [Didymodactylos carnosus]|uniref:Centrosome-associated FAM110 C-terminal domain-containing protein n=1 Tax=Didymodactylos carnosus TaxID=1234261 RepID=A0A815THN7_9BILA|nr:unnamed protein product [Didymodactylos carnosus]CAF4365331.1 unnamed protein product [Didymodactylos carnosus]
MFDLIQSNHHSTSTVRQEYQSTPFTSLSTKSRSSLQLNKSKYRDFDMGMENEEDILPVDHIITPQRYVHNISDTRHKSSSRTNISSQYPKTVTEFDRLCDGIGMDLSSSYKVPSTTTDDNYFESVSMLSLDRRTLTDQSNDSDAQVDFTATQFQSIVERNAKVIKWLFNMKKANQSPIGC